MPTEAVGAGGGGGGGGGARCPTIPSSRLQRWTVFVMKLRFKVVCLLVVVVAVLVLTLFCCYLPPSLPTPPQTHPLQTPRGSILGACICLPP